MEGGSVDDGRGQGWSRGADVDDAFEARQTGSQTVRELMDELSQLDRDLRRTPLLTTADGNTAVNPEVASLLRRRRRVVAALRARRTSWSQSQAPTARSPSASWPPPPWSP